MFTILKNIIIIISLFIIIYYYFKNNYIYLSINLNKGIYQI
jgi:hypothetical protein